MLISVSLHIQITFRCVCLRSLNQQKQARDSSSHGLGLSRGRLICVIRIKEGSTVLVSIIVTMMSSKQLSTDPSGECFPSADTTAIFIYLSIKVIFTTYLLDSSAGCGKIAPHIVSVDNHQDGTWNIDPSRTVVVLRPLQHFCAGL